MRWGLKSAMERARNKRVLELRDFGENIPRRKGDGGDDDDDDDEDEEMYIASI